MRALGPFLFLLSAVVVAQAQPPQALSQALQCAGKDCSLLTGVPQTNGMRSGFVRLKPGESVGAHSTEDHEEALVILHGQGDAKVGDRTLTFSAGSLIYIPRRSHHNVTNTGSDLLEYVYVVAPTSKQ